MLQASLYITLCSARNRLRVRLRRLREPRYLLGGIVGVAYLYFSVFARGSGRARAARRAGGAAGRMPPALAAMATAGPALGGMALLAITALSWILPGSSGLLTFSEAEIQFLFPAPVPRRQLLIHRMLRSQLGLLFGSLVVGIMTPSVGGFARLRVSIATWIVLVTAKIYFAGVSLSRARLRQGFGVASAAEARATRVAWTPIIVLVTAVAIVVIALTRAFAGAPPSSPIELFSRIRDVAAQRWVWQVLWPFTAVAQPIFAEWPTPYLRSVVVALGVLAATAVWVLQSDDAFEEAAAAAAEHRAAEVTQSRPSYRVRSGGWLLTPAGRPEGAFAWKAAMQTIRLVDRRSIMRLVALLFALSVISVSLGRGRGFATIVGFFATVGAAMAVLFAPQVLRIDMRQDLRHLELLKTWPVTAATIVRGQLLWPGALITACAWALLAVALTMSGLVFTKLGWGWRVSAATSAAILAPALIFAQLTIHNGVALLFPAWVPLGMQRPRGLDAMGQRLIMLGGTWLLLAVGAMPAAIGGGIVWFAFRWMIGNAAMIPGALVATAIAAIEVLLATEALGPAYERIDILAVERSE
jgi:ABC-2 type transport system permease protein